MTVWPVFGRRILARLRPEAVEVLIESLEAFPEDFHVLSALGLAEGALKGGDDEGGGDVDLNAGADGAGMLTVAERPGSSPPCVRSVSPPWSGPCPRTRAKVSSTSSGASPSRRTSTGTPLAVSAKASVTCTVVTGSGGSVGSPGGLIRTTAVPTPPLLSLAMKAKASSGSFWLAGV